MSNNTTINSIYLNKEQFISQVLNDYRVICMSREASLLGRKEVLNGKAKFGIFGDGKELAQLVNVKFFNKGDFRSGYYRDQTFMMAIGKLSVQNFCWSLCSYRFGKRTQFSWQTNGWTFFYKSVDKDGNWLNLIDKKNTSSDISCTGAQMPRLVGLGLASKVYRQNKELKDFKKFSNNGNEVAFGTIGDASTSEGVFWESMNAACVLEIPLVMSVWDDGYGISVEKNTRLLKKVFLRLYLDLKLKTSQTV